MHAARSRAAWDLARAQHGVLTRGDLEGLRFSAEAIDHRLETGRLHLISRGVYAVGRPELTPHGRWTAAVLVCGDGAALSHRSAAELWGIGFEEPGRIDVTIRRRSMIRRKGLKVRARPSLGADAVVVRFGIPVTHPVQTLVDLATELRPLRLERAVNEADKHDLVDPETLRRALALEVYRGMPGVGTLTKHWVLGHETDFFFPDHRLIVEADGLRYHRTASQQARMVRRDQKHVAAGYTVLRFTHWQIAHAPAEVTGVLRQVRARRG